MTENPTALILFLLLASSLIAWLSSHLYMRQALGDEKKKKAEVIQSADQTIGNLRREKQEAEERVEPLHAENDRLGQEVDQLKRQFEQTKNLHNQALANAQQMEQQLHSLRDCLATEQQRVEKVQEMLRAASAGLQDEINAHFATRNQMAAQRARASAIAEELNRW